MSKKSKDVVPQNVPVQRTDLSTFDDSLAFLKEKFAAEMQRMDDEMTKFSVNLLTLYGQQGSSATPSQTSGGQSTWDALANSPLIQGEGTDKMLKLQFDVSSFDPADIKVDILDDRLVVYAHHAQKTDTSEMTREFRREFLLPRGINPANIISSLSRDGVLTVQAPLPQLVDATEPQKHGKEKNVLSKTQETTKPSKRTKESLDKIATDEKAAIDTKVPAALAGQVPQSPLSPVSPASPALATSLTSPTTPSITTPQKTSKTASKTANRAK